MNGPSYREFRPAGALGDMVQCFWTLRSSDPLPTALLNRVVPDGRMDIIFNLGDPPLREGCPHHSLRSYVVGAMTAPMEVRHRGVVDIVGVRFRPAGAYPFVRMPARELLDQVIPLDDVWSRNADEAESRLAEVSAAGRPKVLEELLRRAVGTGWEVSTPTSRAAEMIEASGGRLPVRQVAKRLGMSTRQLERLFAAHVGLTPKMASRVARFQRALGKAAAPGLHPSWSELALTCGYTDQAHLTHDFRELSGLPPGAYRRERANVAFVQDRTAGEA